METDSSQRQKVGWSQAQWAQIDQVVAENVDAVRVTHEIMPTHKLERTATAVPIDLLDRRTLTIDYTTTMPLAEVSIQFQLDKQQVEEEALSGAMGLIKRAAINFSRLEDQIVMNGLFPNPAGGLMPPGGLPPQARVDRGQQNGGLRAIAQPPVVCLGGPAPYGDRMVSAVVRGITMLDAVGYVKPYLLVLSEQQSAEVDRPDRNSLVLPRDRIEPKFEKKIITSPVLPAPTGLLLSISGNPTDRAVAIEPTLRFIHINGNDRYLFSIYGVFALRRKEPEAVIELRFI